LRDGGRAICVVDMAPERNALMQHVYPQLKEFCRKEYRLEFQVAAKYLIQQQMAKTQRRSTILRWANAKLS